MENHGKTLFTGAKSLQIQTLPCSFQDSKSGINLQLEMLTKTTVRLLCLVALQLCNFALLVREYSKTSF